MARIGVVGLGNIGGAIAANVVADGHDTWVFDVDAARAAGIDGAKAAGSVGELAAACEITLTSLPTPEVVSAVADEWAAAAPAGSILLDISTTAPASNRAIAERLAASGHHFVEAPLTGGAPGAKARMLVFMVGGDAESFERVKPVLDQLGRATFHVGPIGAGTTMKLVNSLIAFSCTWASLEALSLAAAGGIELRTAVEVVRTAGASNFFIDRGVEGIDERGRPQMFAIGLAAKDAGLLADLAAEHGVPAAVVGALVEVLGDAVARGLGDADWSDLVVAAEQRAGVQLRLGPPAGG